MRSRSAATLVILGIALVALLAVAFAIQYAKPPTEEGSVSVVMCPRCEQAFLAAIRGGGEIVCALYDVGPTVGDALATAGATVITDEESKAAYGTPIREYGLMHNKFCVVNGSLVLTGSYNPTENGEENRNNLVIVQSERLAANYRAEYEAIARDRNRGRVAHQLKVGGIELENYFCPRDRCEEQVAAELAAAREEILYLTYSFTSERLARVLEERRAQGVRVEGVCEHSQAASDYSVCARLGAAEWTRPGLLHHKVFIIDRTTVVTGSYNPTNSGDRRNRENILIIHDPLVAQTFLAEYADIEANLPSP